MSKQNYRWFVLLFICSLVIFAGCSFQRSPNANPPLDSSMLFTQAAGTIQAQYTLAALFNTRTPEPTQTPEPTNSPFPTFTETSTPFPTLSPTPLVLLPSNTPIPPTRVVPSFTPVPLVCDRAQLVRDVSIQDNSPFAPGKTFVKTWQLKNIGNCTWTQNYSLVFVSGDAMNATLSIPLPKNVEPGQTIDLSATMKSPAALGTYRGDWMLSNSSGTRFGVGTSGNNTFWVAIRVMKLENPRLVYDFVANYCQAEWKSGAGRLPCPGTSSSTDGFVFLSDFTRLENRQEDEWTILSHPNNSSKGWISGTYPEFEILPGHHFIAWVGCLADSKGCNVIFRLDFKNLKTDAIKDLGAWYEVYDGEVTKIDLDLSQHAGKRVRFILTVEVNGGTPERANAFWFVPGIIQGTPPTATPTLIPPTPTPTDDNGDSHD